MNINNQIANYAICNSTMYNSDMAELSGYHRSTLHRWETGKTKPNEIKVRDLCQCCGFDYDEVKDMFR